MENSSVILLVVAIAGGLFLLWIILYLIPVGLWFQALVSDVKISLLQLVLMRWRKVPPTVIVSAMIEGKKAGIELYRDLLEAHYLAGGHVAQVVHALVSASKANIDLTFQIATAVDLAGRDVFEAVQMSVNPKVINTPPVTAVAKDGIQLIAKALGHRRRGAQTVRQPARCGDVRGHRDRRDGAGPGRRRDRVVDRFVGIP